MNENILAEIFIECLLFAYKFISFSCGKVMTLDCYFKKKSVLPYPDGYLCSTTHPTVIASINCAEEVTWEDTGSTNAGIRTEMIITV